MGGETFTYKTAKDDMVRIFWEGRCVMTLGGAWGRRLSAELATSSDPGDAQRILQRVTGNFRRGNERLRGR